MVSVVLCGTPAHKTVRGVLGLSWEGWDEPINKLGTRKTKTGAGAWSFEYSLLLHVGKVNVSCLLNKDENQASDESSCY